MRSEACVCGGLIVAPSLIQSPPYVEAHNATDMHVAWRIDQRRTRLAIDLHRELVPRGLTTYHDPRRRPTAVTASVDVSGNTNGASADGGGVA